MWANVVEFVVKLWNMWKRELRSHKGPNPEVVVALRYCFGCLACKYHFTDSQSDGDYLACSVMERVSMGFGYAEFWHKNCESFELNDIVSSQQLLDYDFCPKCGSELDDPSIMPCGVCGGNYVDEYR